jgi:hypothetical protein
MRNWDTQFCAAAEPEICFIYFVALLISHLHCTCGVGFDLEWHARSIGSRNIPSVVSPTIHINLEFASVPST